MTVLTFFIVFIGFAYFVLISAFLVGFLRTEQFSDTTDLQEETQMPFLSVVIAFKDEEQNLPILLESLKLQSLSKDSYEIIFVNDFSTEEVSVFLQNTIKKLTNVKLIQNTLQQSKKYALKCGIIAAKGTHIVTTDADCRPSPAWLETIFNHYRNCDSKMLIAPVIFQSDTFFGQIQTLDFLSLTASGYGAAGLKKPILCNGANFSYEKSLFFEFEDSFRYDIPSGDDVFLLHAAKKKYADKIRFLKSKNAVVFSSPVSNMTELIRQRKRWASKSKKFSDKFTLLTAFIVLLMYLVLFLVPILSVFMTIKPLLWLPLIFKIAIDFIFLAVVSAYFKQGKLMRLFLPVWILSGLFSLFIAVIAIFSNRK